MLHYGTCTSGKISTTTVLNLLLFDATSVNRMVVVFSFSICHLVWIAEEYGPSVFCSDIQNGHFLLNIVDTLVLTGSIETLCFYENLA
jgi:hypothetical protein